MALESVNAAETLIQSNVENDDLEDGEIPSDEDDDTTEAPKPVPVDAAAKPVAAKAESPKHHKNYDAKFGGKSKKSSNTNSSNTDGNGSSSKQDRFGKYKPSPSEDWAGDVEKAIRAAMDELDRSKENNKPAKAKSNRSKNRKRNRDEKEDDRAKEQKKRKMSDEENGNEDDDEMLFVRGASPVSRREAHDTPRSPPRRSSDRDNYDSVSDNDDRPGDRRQRDNDSNKRANSSNRGAGRRGGKADRGGKNKNRAQLRNERNGRRNQDHQNTQDPDAICVYYMQGKCHRGDDCPFSHNALPPRKMELCKFYLMDCCAKRDKCLYMHHDFPCKFFHTGLSCVNGENCKFSHEPLNEQVKNILLKHLETAPKEILGDFPRLSREGALLMINNTVRNAAQGQENTGQKIPSLFDVTLPVPVNSAEQEDEESRGNIVSAPIVAKDQSMALQPKRPATAGKDRKGGGKKTRWGSDDDRVPYEQIMLLQSVSQLGLHLPNVALGLAVQQQLQQHILIQQCIANMEFYNEIHGSPPDGAVQKDKGNKETNKNDFAKDPVGEDQLSKARTNAEDVLATTSKDVDLRAILAAKRILASSSVTEETAGTADFSTSKFDDESDRDEETNLIIEMPVDDDERNKDDDKDRLKDSKYIHAKKSRVEIEEINEDGTPETSKLLADSANLPDPLEDQEIPRNLPKRAQELFMRIQQQQRTAMDSLSIGDDKVEVEDSKNRDNWYSEDEDERGPDDGNDDDDEDDDDDDDEAGNLTIVIKDSQKDEMSDRGEDGGQETSEEEKVEKSIPELPQVPQPAVFADKLGNLSKIDISAEVTKLLSSIKPQSSKSSRSETSCLENRNAEENSKFAGSGISREVGRNSPRYTEDERMSSKNSLSRAMENGESSPSRASGSGSVSRDPRMSRDPRQRRDEQKSSMSPSRSDSSKKESRSMRLETSIYSSGITSAEGTMDTDLRARLDQDHRRKDMDLRQRFPQQDFGDTDLRMVGGSFSDSSSRSDVDLRQMLSLPFKPAPSHVPCTEIAASISSHPPLSYRVYTVDIPRPDFTGLKLTPNDPQIRYDPRMRKIFGLPKVDIADSPMSPPPQATIPKPDTPKSPPLVRSDPRRKALEVSNQSSQVMPPVMSNSAVGMMPGQQQVQQQQQPQQQQQQHMPPEGMPGIGSVQGMQGPPGMTGMQPMGQNPMGQNPMGQNPMGQNPMGQNPMGQNPMGPNPMMGGMGPMGPMMGGPMQPPGMAPMGIGMPGPGMGNGPPMPQNQMAFDPRFAAQRNGGPGLLGPAPGLGYGPDVGPPGPPGYDGNAGYPGPGNFGNYGPPAPGAPANDVGMMGFGANGPNTGGSFGGNVPPAEWAPANQNQMRRGGRVRRRNRNRTNTGPNNRGNRSPI